MFKRERRENVFHVYSVVFYNSNYTVEEKGTGGGGIGAHTKTTAKERERERERKREGPGLASRPTASGPHNPG